MLDRLGDVLVGAVGLGFCLLVIAGSLGDQSGLAWVLFLIGGALIVIGLPLAMLVGAVLLVRRLLGGRVRDRRPS